MDPNQKYDLSFLAALYQGAFFTFFRGDSYFDSSLWTMRSEFFGSFVVFGLTAVAGGAKRSGAIPSALIVFTAILAAYFSMIDIIAFIVGMSLALYLPRRRSANAFLTCVLIAAALYLLGYPGRAVGYYSPLVLPPSFTTFPLVAGAAMLILAFETSAILPTKFSGKLSHYIGEFSFPLYLVHVPIISSVGSWTYLSYGPRLAVLVSILASVAAALPLLVFNRNWLAIVNRMTERTMRGRSLQ